MAVEAYFRFCGNLLKFEPKIRSAMRGMSSEGARLLTQLLALSRQQISQELPNSLRIALEPVRSTELLLELLNAPRAEFRSKIGLFEAVRILDLENPQSDLLAWLMHEGGPLGDCTLLQAIFSAFVLDVEWSGPPQSVSREEVCEGGRVDIVVKWPSFTLIIENKVWSADGHLQASRYLNSFDIASPTVGRLIHLSPIARWPADIDSGDPRVVAIGFKQLSRVVQRVLDASVNMPIRGRVFLEEFKCGLENIMGVYTGDDKPPLSESTLLYIKNARELDQIRKVAVDESKRVVGWLQDGVTKVLRERFGDDLEVEEMSWGIFYGLQAWNSANYATGICFCKAEGWKEGLLRTSGDESFYLGVMVESVQGGATRSERCQLVDRLSPMVKAVWPYPDDLYPNDDWGPLWRQFVWQSVDELDAMREALIACAVELIDVMTPVLTQFVAHQLKS